MKQNLQLRLSQNLALTPQLQQSIRLLQLSTLELNQELETILQDNPLLELVDSDEDHSPDVAEVSATEDINNSDNIESSASEVQEIDINQFDSATITEISAPIESVAERQDDDAPNTSEEFTSPEFEDEYDEYGSASNWDESGRQNNSDDDDGEYTRQEIIGISLRDHLLGQLKLVPLSDRDQTLVSIMVDCINEDGYFEQSLEALAESLPLELEIDPLELETILKLIQNLDPVGVGARNLPECLSLQLNALPADTPYLKQAQSIAKDHLAVLANKDFGKLRKLLNCDDAALKGAHTLIKQQNPKPGSDFVNLSHDHFIQHDVVVKKIKGIWVATLNDGVIPKLRINQLYADILKRNRENSGQYLQSQMQEAKWMIKNIQQRFSTILRVSQAIVDRQRNFFEHGEIAMRPLVLREIAEELELHESTISRVTTHKYMLTPRGVYELKYFFGSSVATDVGGTCSATAIRALIKQMVTEENPKKPLSDNQITETLASQGIVVARRTIAKYRESLNIPPANLRKSL